MARMPTLNANSSLTFFYVADVVRATDHSAQPTWTVPASSTSHPLVPIRWAKPDAAPVAAARR